MAALVTRMPDLHKRLQGASLEHEKELLRVRMFERNISTDELIVIISTGEIIETYSDDEPCPSVLIMGFIDTVAYHTVIALCRDHIRVITVYIPEEDKWIEYRKRRIES